MEAVSSSETVVGRFHNNCPDRLLSPCVGGQYTVHTITNQRSVISQQTQWPPDTKQLPFGYRTHHPPHHTPTFFYYYSLTRICVAPKHIFWVHLSPAIILCVCVGSILNVKPRQKRKERYPIFFRIELYILKELTSRRRSKPEAVEQISKQTMPFQS